jgi:hypothetical protein
MGPFTNYAPPATYTQSFLESNFGGLLANLRVPALIGTADEIQKVSGYEMIRGSSAIQDNKKVGEDVSGQFAIAGTRTCRVANYPIVVGDGMGRVTTNTNDVKVYVDGVQVIVAKVNGLSGEITLALSPKTTATVTVTYYYKKTDTKVVDEDLSEQVDGTTATFYTHHKPIVDGTSAGKATTKTSDIIVKVNGSIVDVAHVDGVNGNFTLSVPPASSDMLTVTYYFNLHADTSDDLPVLGVTQMIRVGVSPETSDFIENADYAIIGNQIQWGSGYKLVSVIHTTGGEFFNEDKIVGQLYDEKIYREDVSTQIAGVAGKKWFAVKYLPIVDGTGRDITTNDPTNVIVTVNGIAVNVIRVDGENGKVYLQNTVNSGAKVLVTYWRSRLADDIYSLEVVMSGDVGVGTYKITSLDSGRIGNAVLGAKSTTVSNVEFLSGPVVSKTYTVDETVTLIFTSATQFSVTSSVPGGSTGAGETDTTYIDENTDLMFALKSDLYSNGDTIEIVVTKEAIFVTSAIPVLSIPCVKLTVLNTTDVISGDITDLYVYNKSGKEPAVSDYYYISYFYQKQNYECGLYTRFKDVVNDYGDLKASNPLVLAAYLTFMNGANAMILCQVKKAANSDLAADQAYIDVLARLQQDVNGINPAVILPVTTSQVVINATAQHCAIQSSMRNRRERISFFGYAVGTEPTDAANYALAVNSERMIAIYPDGAVIELVDPDGTVTSNVIDGSFLAAAFCGLNVSPAYDVATPMTKKTLQGFKALIRAMDETTMDMVATRGVTIIQNISSVFVIRHGMTTNMSSALTREIMITTIKDFIQQETRRICDAFIGIKLTPNIPGSIANVIGAMLNSAVNSQIITAYKGVTAAIDKDQPDYVVVSAEYVPIFGLNWIGVTYSIRTKF